MMVVLNLAVIAPMATGDMMVTAVNEGMSDLYLEGMCADEDCNDLSDDWKLSTEQRDFYGWSITNLEDVNVNGSEPEYETVGPVTYDVTSEREFISHDEEERVEEEDEPPPSSTTSRSVGPTHQTKPTFNVLYSNPITVTNNKTVHSAFKTPRLPSIVSIVCVDDGSFPAHLSLSPWRTMTTEKRFLFLRFNSRFVRCRVWI